MQTLENFMIGSYTIEPWHTKDGRVMATVRASSGAIVQVVSGTDVHDVERKARKAVGL